MTNPRNPDSSGSGNGNGSRNNGRSSNWNEVGALFLSGILAIISTVFSLADILLSGGFDLGDIATVCISFSTYFSVAHALVRSQYISTRYHIIKISYFGWLSVILAGGSGVTSFLYAFHDKTGVKLVILAKLFTAISYILNWGAMGSSCFVASRAGRCPRYLPEIAISLSVWFGVVSLGALVANALLSKDFKITRNGFDSVMFSIISTIIAVITEVKTEKWHYVGGVTIMVILLVVEAVLIALAKEGKFFSKL